MVVLHLELGAVVFLIGTDNGVLLVGGDEAIVQTVYCDSRGFY